MAVGLIRFEEPSGAIARALELSNGFDGLRSDSKVVIKPNVVIGSRVKSRPSPGVVTSAIMVEEVIKLLRGYGCKDIAVGEGSVVLADMGFDTMMAFAASGISDVAEKHGVELIDFNAGPSESMELDGGTVRVSRRALETDFFINMPVLKTHTQTKITLGLKNLKGCIDIASKKKFHDKLDLETSIAILATKIPVSLTIIDGTYGLQRGPFGSDLRKMNLVVAGKDRLSVDIVGSQLMGIDPRSVVHLRKYAELTGRTLDDVEEVRGTRIEELAQKLEWHADWPSELLSRYGIDGMVIDTPGHSNCSGCSVAIFAALDRFLRENQGTVFDAVEICIGKEPIAKSRSRQVFLLGKCPMFVNRERKDAIKVAGCPPTVQGTYETLMKNARKLGHAHSESKRA